MDQRLWVYEADDRTFWVPREPSFALSWIPAPILEMGTAVVEPHALAARTRDDLNYAGVAKISAADATVWISRLEPTAVQTDTLAYRSRPEA